MEERQMQKQNLVFFLSLIMATQACQTTTPSPEPSSVPVPTSTPRAVPIQNILPQAKESCAAAENTAVVGGFITPPVLALKQAVYESNEWEVETLFNNQAGVLAKNADEVQVLVCIREERNESGSYDDGQPALDTTWTIWFVSWPRGEVLGRMSLLSVAQAVKMNPGPGIGDPPVLDLVNVLLKAQDSKVLAVSEDGLAETTIAAGRPVMAVVDEESQITVWDLERGSILNQFVVNSDVWLVNDPALSPDGSLVAVTGIMDSTTRVFDTNTGAELYTLITQAPTFSPDGSILATGNPTREHVATFEIWLSEPRTGNLIAKLPEARVDSFAFSTDSSWLVSMDPFGEIMLWDAVNHTLANSFEGLDTGDAQSVAISADGKFLATQSPFNGVRVWETGSSEPLYSTEGSNGAFISRVQFSTDGRMLAFAGPASLADSSVSNEEPALEDILAQMFASHKITLLNLGDLSVTEIELPLDVANFFFADNEEGLYVVLSGGVVLLISDTVP
jgi:hypothetical protein